MYDNLLEISVDNRRGYWWNQTWIEPASYRENLKRICFF